MVLEGVDMEIESLNRTSVGLKPARASSIPALISSSLNRTSVGLKQEEAIFIPFPTRTASIEPAWD